MSSVATIALRHDGRDRGAGHEDAPLDRVAGDRRAVAGRDLGDDVGPVGRELRDARHPDEIGREGARRREPRNGDDGERQEDESGRAAAGLSRSDCEAFGPRYAISGGSSAWRASPKPRSSSESSGKPSSYLDAQARATAASGSSPTSRRRATRRRRSSSSSTASRTAAPTRCSSASRAPARRSRSRRSIEAVNRPTLVLSHNKTLAAQLYQEFRSFFPKNAVEYFVSYYDYYQPEAYVPQSDTYIEKETSRNDEIDKLRLAASKALFERRDVIIVASVSCIYGLGAPESYYDMLAYLEVGDAQGMPALLARLVEMQYERTTSTSTRGTFRVRGDVLEIQPAYEDTAVRVEFFGDEIEKITRIDPSAARRSSACDRLALYPAHLLRHAARDARAGDRDDPRWSSTSGWPS